MFTLYPDDDIETNGSTLARLLSVACDCGAASATPLRDYKSCAIVRAVYESPFARNAGLPRYTPVASDTKPAADPDRT